MEPTKNPQPESFETQQGQLSVSSEPLMTPEEQPSALNATISPSEQEPAVDRVSFLESSQQLGTGQSWDIALGDLDSDGDLDAFVANAIQGGVSNSVWSNDGQGSFTLSQQTSGYGQGVALGDLDGDRDLDAVVTNWWGEEVSSIWLNNGSGIFADSGQDLGFAFRPSLGDLDGDGDLDLYLAQVEANTVWLNDGDGTFTDTGQRLGTAITAAVGLDDLDGDGDLDALVGGWDEAAKAWLNDGNGTFSQHDQTLSSASVHIHDLALDDLNGDDIPDVFMAVASGHPNQIWVNNGTGKFSYSNQQLHSSLAHGVSLGDIDGDGDIDAVTAHGEPGSSGGKIWLNNGTGGFHMSDFTLGNLFSPAIALGDLDGDDDLDIFIAHGDLMDESDGGIPNRVWLNELISSVSINVPLGNPPSIDGTISPSEWDGAALETFADGSQLLLMQDGRFLYVGIRANEAGTIAGNVFIQRGDEISILHSSAALGTAIYQKSEDRWQQIQDFKWRCRSTSNTEAARAERADFLQDEGWLAANGLMGTPNELEYQINIPEQDFRLAVVFLRSTPPYEKIPWPKALDDDTITPTPGGFPDLVYFSPEQWVVLDLSK